MANIWVWKFILAPEDLLLLLKACQYKTHGKGTELERSNQPHVYWDCYGDTTSTCNAVGL